MRLAKPALTPLLLLTTLGASHLGVPGQLAGWGEHLAFEGWAHAQSLQSTPAPTLKVYSRETIVDVTVTDSKGNPVRGLTQSDFTVKEDNKPQPIRSFEEFGSAAPTPAKPLPKLPPNVYTNLQPPPASSTVNIFLVDFLNIAAMPGPEVRGGEDAIARAFAAQNAVKSEAKKYVASMPPGTRVIVLGLSNSLRTLQGLTSDPALLSASIDTLDYNALGRASTYNQYCFQAELRTRMTLEALNQIAADASGIKGKKNLLWFSVGIPWLTDPNARPECLPDYFSDLLKTYGLFTAAQIAVYPVDARGVPTMPNAFITSKGKLWADVPNLPNPPVPYNKVAAQLDFYQTTAEQQLSMESIAEATGGYAYYNSNDIAGEITKAIDKGSNYYTLSYVPPGGYNWAHHTIKVAIDKPDLHLVYRESYDAVDPATIKPTPGLTLAAILPEAGPHPDPEAEMSTAMGRSMPTSQQLLFDVQIEPSTQPAKPTDPPIFGMLNPKLKGKPLTRYGFQFAIPGRQITFTADPNATRHAALEFDLAAYDADGNLISSLSQSINLPLTAGQAAQLAHSPFRFFQQLDLPSGQLFLRIGILDRTSSKIGTLEIPLTIPKK
jgi:VWFA-related protein